MTTDLQKETQQLKRQFAMSFHNDGLVDFFVGWSIVSVGLFLLTHLSIFSFVGWMPLLLVAPLKSWLILPRWGYARFSSPTRIPRPVLITAGAIIVLGALFFNFVRGDDSGLISPIAIGLLGLSLVVVLRTGLNRIAIYAVFIPLFFIIGLGLKVLTPALVILVGAALMVLGLSLFVLFMKKYPLIEGES